MTPAENIVENVCKIKKDERVLIIANPETNDIAQDLYLACNKVNAKPFKIIVDPDERTIVYEAKSEKEHFFMFDDIKSVYDYGEYYHFWQGDMFLCQKSLLVQGTLEEFEKLFDGKIIRKY